MILPNSTMKKKAEAQYYLAYALYINGDFNHARKEIDTALLFDSNFEKASKLRKTILEQEELTQEKIKKLKQRVEGEDAESDDETGSLELGGDLEKSGEGETEEEKDIGTESPQ